MARFLVTAQAELYTYVDAEDEKQALRKARTGKRVRFHRTMCLPLDNYKVVPTDEEPA